MSSNYTYVSPNVYIVRTQAGYRNAIKDWLGRDDEVNDYIKGAVGYPLIYPALVVFSMAYRGYHYVHCNTIPFNLIQSAIAESDAQYHQEKGITPVQSNIEQLKNENLRLNYNLNNLKLRADHYKKEFKDADALRLKAEQKTERLTTIVSKGLDTMYDNITSHDSSLEFELLDIKDKFSQAL